MNDENSPWQYKPDGDAPAQNNLAPSDNSTPAAPQRDSSSKSHSWEALEYIDHPHGAGWYLALVLITAALAAAAYLTLKDRVATGTIVVVGIIVGIFASQKPHRAKYEISPAGLSVNGKLYGLGNYKSFAVIREDSLSSIYLFPLRRFMPPLSAYFEPKDEARITALLGDYLPYEDRELDAIDRLSRRLRL